MNLKKRILSCLNECHIITPEQIWRRFYDTKGYKISFAIEEMQIEGILVNVSDPGFPIGWKDFFQQR